MDHTSVIELLQISRKYIKIHMHFFMTAILNSWEKNVCGTVIDNRKNATICVLDEDDR